MQALGRRLAGKLSRLVREPAFVVGLGGVVGALLAAAALAGGNAQGWHIPAMSTASSRTLYGGFVTGTITATSVLFWIRGTFVQLGASEMSPRLLRGYMRDWFLNLAFAFLVGVFAYSVVTLLWLPSGDETPAPALPVVVGAALVFATLVLIVHAVHNSVSAMNPSRVLTSLTEQTLEVVRRRPLLDGSGPAMAEDTAGEGTGRELGTVTADRAGWLSHIDDEALTTGLPERGVVRLEAAVGDFVTAGARLATVFARDDADEWDPAGIEAAFTFDLERQPGDDAEYGLQNLVSLAAGSLAPGSGDRSSAFEALRCLLVLLDELLRRETSAAVKALEGDRVVVRRHGRTHRDIVRGTLGELRPAAPESPEFARALITDARRLASRLETDGFEDGAALVAVEAEALAAALDGHGETDDQAAQPRSNRDSAASSSASARPSSSVTPEPARNSR